MLFIFLLQRQQRMAKQTKSLSVTSQKLLGRALEKKQLSKAVFPAEKNLLRLYKNYFFVYGCCYHILYNPERHRCCTRGIFACANNLAAASSLPAYPSP